MSETKYAVLITERFRRHDLPEPKALQAQRAVTEVLQQLVKDHGHWDVAADRAEIEAHTRAWQRQQKAQQRQRQTRTLQRCLDAIVWEWDNPYIDPGDWTPLEEGE